MSAVGHRFRLIVFDVDGTLVDSQHVIASATAAAFAAEGLAAPDPAAVRRQVGLGVEETMARLLPEGETGLHRRLAVAFREAAFEMRRHPGYAEPLYPGIREALDSLCHPAVFFGIATGKPGAASTTPWRAMALRRCSTPCRRPTATPASPTPRFC